MAYQAFILFGLTIHFPVKDKCFTFAIRMIAHRYITIIITLSVIYSCGGSNKQQLPPSRRGEITGTWQVHAILTSEIEKLKNVSHESYMELMSQMIDSSSYMQFNNDSTFSGKIGPDVAIGKWDISPDSKNLITIDPKGRTEIMKIVKLSKDSLVLLNLSYDNKITLEMSRQR
jgi:hypothetical protein